MFPDALRFPKERRVWPSFAAAFLLVGSVVLPGDLGSRPRGDRLRSLSYKNPRLIRLRREIAANIRSWAQKGALDRPLRLVRYRLGPGDHFYRVMARTSSNSDTLASLNSLPNPNALRSGDVLLIPNARGLFLRGKRSKLARRYGKPEESFIALDGGWFLPGHRFPRKRRDYFLGRVFYPPLRRMRVTSNFGYRRDPFTRRSVFHGGLDIGAPRGAPVYASRGGVVEFAGRSGGYGNLIILRHEYGYRTYYGHLSRISVRRGGRVRTGRVIGRVGSTGRATGPHLHFELRQGDRRKRPRFHRPFRISAAR